MCRWGDGESFETDGGAEGSWNVKVQSVPLALYFKLAARAECGRPNLPLGTRF